MKRSKKPHLVSLSLMKAIKTPKVRTRKRQDHVDIHTAIREARKESLRRRKREILQKLTISPEEYFTLVKINKQLSE